MAERRNVLVPDGVLLTWNHTSPALPARRGTQSPSRCIAVKVTARSEFDKNRPCGSLYAVRNANILFFGAAVVLK